MGTIVRRNAVQPRTATTPTTVGRAAARPATKAPKATAARAERPSGTTATVQAAAGAREVTRPSAAKATKQRASAPTADAKRAADRNALARRAAADGKLGPTDARQLRAAGVPTAEVARLKRRSRAVNTAARDDKVTTKEAPKLRRVGVPTESVELLQRGSRNGDITATERGHAIVPSPYNQGRSHGLVHTEVKSGKLPALLDATGTPMTGVNLLPLAFTAKRGRFQGDGPIVRTKDGRTLVYTWGEHGKGKQNVSGFIDRADLKRPSSMPARVTERSGNDIGPAYKGSDPLVAHRVDPKPLAGTFAHGGRPNATRPIDDYGVSRDKLGVVYLASSLPNTPGGGTARSIVRTGDTFHASTRERERVPLTDGKSVEFAYGYVEQNAKRVWGWIATPNLQPAT